MENFGGWVIWKPIYTRLHLINLINLFERFSLSINFDIIFWFRRYIGCRWFTLLCSWFCIKKASSSLLGRFEIWLADFHFRFNTNFITIRGLFIIFSMWKSLWLLIYFEFPLDSSFLLHFPHIFLILCNLIFILIIIWTQLLTWLKATKLVFWCLAPH